MNVAPFEPDHFEDAVPYYLKHRVRYADRLIGWIAAEASLTSSSRVLDLGCGPGPLAIDGHLTALVEHSATVARRPRTRRDTATYALRMLALQNRCSGSADGCVNSMKTFGGMSHGQRSGSILKGAIDVSPVA